MKSIIIYFLFFIACKSNLIAQIEVQLEADKQIIYPISDLSKLSDFNQLKSLFSAKKIIGLGESTHGAKEFFKIKCQLIKFLIDSCGYTNLILETPFLSSLYVNEFIKNEKGNIDTTLKMLETWIFYTQEFRDLLLWIRKFNSSKKKDEQVNIYGIDIQSITNFTDFLISNVNEEAKISKSKLKEIINANLPYQLTSSIQLKNLSTKNLELLALISILLKDWYLEYEEDIKKYHTAEISFLIKTAITAFQLVINSSNQPYSYRDSCMAILFEQIAILRPDSKIIIWSHNQHVSTYDSIVKYPIYNNTLGNYINKKYKSLYYPIGLIFNKGSFIALEQIKKKKTFIYPHLKINYLESVKDNSLAFKFSQTGYPIFFTDIEMSKNEIFKKYSKIYTIGAIYSNQSPTNTLYITPSFSFKGLIFVNSINFANQIDNYFYKTIK